MMFPCTIYTKHANFTQPVAWKYYRGPYVFLYFWKNHDVSYILTIYKNIQGILRKTHITLSMKSYISHNNLFHNIFMLLTNSNKDTMHVMIRRIVVPRMSCRLFLLSLISNIFNKGIQRVYKLFVIVICQF